MAGLTIKCPSCGNKMNVRSSSQPTPTTIEAFVFCVSCCNFKAKFLGEITDIKTAEWKDCQSLKNEIFEENKLRYKYKQKEEPQDF